MTPLRIEGFKPCDTTDEFGHPTHRTHVGQTLMTYGYAVGDAIHIIDHLPQTLDPLPPCVLTFPWSIAELKLTLSNCGAIMTGGDDDTP
jgi:hypothetical protein